VPAPAVVLRPGTARVRKPACPAQTSGRELHALAESPPRAAGAGGRGAALYVFHLVKGSSCWAPVPHWASGLAPIALVCKRNTTFPTSSTAGVYTCARLASETPKRALQATQHRSWVLPPTRPPHPGHVRTSCNLVLTFSRYLSRSSAESGDSASPTRSSASLPACKPAGQESSASPCRLRSR
jgi:hypothetical protein